MYDVFLFWPIIFMSTFFDIFKFKIFAFFHNFKRYNIFKYIVDINFITVLRFFSADIIYRDLVIINIFKYFDRFGDLCCVNYLLQKYNFLRSTKLFKSIKLFKSFYLSTILFWRTFSLEPISLTLQACFRFIFILSPDCPSRTVI